MPATLNQTTIESWLVTNGWAADYLTDFTEKGYEFLEDLGKTDAAAKVVIDAIVDEDDVRSAMLTAWSAATAADASDPGPTLGGGTSPNIPTLPAGQVIDLSAPAITVAQKEYTIPTELGTVGSATSPVSAVSLTNEQWMSIAKRTSLLYGLRMDKVVQGVTSTKALGGSPALYWKVPSKAGWVKSNTHSGSTGSLDYSEQTSDARSNMIVDASASGQYAFCAASFGASRNEKLARARVAKRLYMTGAWTFPRADVTVKACTVASDEFVKAVEVAMGHADADAQFEALKAVFDEFGHVVSRQVTLGGMMAFATTTVTTVAVDENTVVTTVKAAAAVKAGTEKGGEAAASFQIGNATSISAQQIAQMTTWDVVGGDTLAQGNPSSWAATVAQPDLWEIIARDDVVPLVDYIESSLSAKVTAAWNAGLTKVWGSSHVPLGYATPAFYGVQVSIANNPALSPSQRYALGAFTPIANHNIIYAEHGVQASDYPPAVPANMLAAPKANNLLWTFKYSGRFSDNNEPLYWILSGDSKWALSSSTDHGNYGTGAHLVVLSDASKAQHASNPESTNDTWTLMPVDPSKVYGDDYADGYFVTNFATSCYMGPQFNLLANLGVTGMRNALENIDAKLPAADLRSSLSNYIWHIVPSTGI